MSRWVDKSVKVFIAPLALPRCVMRVAVLCHSIYTRSYSGGGCTLFWFLFGAYGLSIDRHRPGFCPSRVYALVLHEVITARKRLATFTYESCKKKKAEQKYKRHLYISYVVQFKKKGGRGKGGGCVSPQVEMYVRFSCVCNDITCRLRCSARAKLLEQPGTAQICARSRASSGSGTLRPRLFLIRCGTGAGGGIRLRGPVRWGFRCSGEDLRSKTGLAPAVGGGEYFSSIFATPTTTNFPFPVAGAETDVSL